MSVNLHQWRSTLFLFSLLLLSLNPIFSLSADAPSPSLLPSDSEIVNSPSPFSDFLSPSSSDNVSDALSPSSSPSPSSGSNLSDPFSPSPSFQSPSPSSEGSNVSDAFSPTPSPSPSVANSNAPSSSPSSSPSPSPTPSPLASPADELPPYSSPSPSPDAGDADDAAVAESHTQTDASKKSDGMNGGHKAGVAFGVIGAACVVGFAGWIYKKRQDNVRRSQYGYNARTTMI